MSIGFRGPKVCKIVGISYRQLDYWARTGLLTPSVKDASGSGSQRLYSYQDLLELKIIKQILDGGVSLQLARKALDFVREHVEEALSAINLVIESDKVVLADSGDELINILMGGQGVMSVVPLLGLRNELDSQIRTDISGDIIAAKNPISSRESRESVSTAIESLGTGKNDYSENSSNTMLDLKSAQ